MSFWDEDGDDSTLPLLTGTEAEGGIYRGRRRNTVRNRGGPAQAVGLPTPEAGSIHQGTVKHIKAFGAFISIPGYDRDGLLHISRISQQRLEKVEDVLAAGDSVWVKVVDVEDGKYSLDMRNVSQSDGTDNDPNNVRSGPQKRKQEGGHERITLGAVYDTTCTRCGGRGHMAYECYNTKDKKYELVADELTEQEEHRLAEREKREKEEDLRRLREEEQKRQEKIQRKEAKRHKKEMKKQRKKLRKAAKKEEKRRKREAKKRDRKSRISDDDDEDSTDEEREKRNRKKRKRTRRQISSSRSSSGSNDSSSSSDESLSDSSDPKVKRRRR